MVLQIGLFQKRFEEECILMKSLKKLFFLSVQYPVKIPKLL